VEFRDVVVARDGDVVQVTVFIAVWAWEIVGVQRKHMERLMDVTHKVQEEPQLQRLFKHTAKVTGTRTSQSKPTKTRKPW
jgi:hypothetical protein